MLTAIGQVWVQANHVGNWEYTANPASRTCFKRITEVPNAQFPKPIKLKYLDQLLQVYQTCISPSHYLPQLFTERNRERIFKIYQHTSETQPQSYLQSLYSTYPQCQRGPTILDTEQVTECADQLSNIILTSNHHPTATTSTTSQESKAPLVAHLESYRAQVKLPREQKPSLTPNRYISKMG